MASSRILYRILPTFGSGRAIIWRQVLHRFARRVLRDVAAGQRSSVNLAALLNGVERRWSEVVEPSQPSDCIFRIMSMSESSVFNDEKPSDFAIASRIGCGFSRLFLSALYDSPPYKLMIRAKFAGELYGELEYGFCGSPDSLS